MQLHATSATFGTASEQLLTIENAMLLPCRLREAPQEILQGLHKLLVANLSFNNINTFSSSAHLSSVAVLNLSFNKLTSLPQDLGQQLPGLQQLYLANNYLSSLPDSLDRVPLHDLFLSENAFEQLPQVRLFGLSTSR